MLWALKYPLRILFGNPIGPTSSVPSVHFEANCVVWGPDLVLAHVDVLTMKLGTSLLDEPYRQEDSNDDKDDADSEDNGEEDTEEDTEEDAEDEDEDQVTGTEGEDDEDHHETNKIENNDHYDRDKLSTGVGLLCSGCLPNIQHVVISCIAPSPDTLTFETWLQSRKEAGLTLSSITFCERTRETITWSSHLELTNLVKLVKWST
jgi:hypothetical protein